MDEEEGWAERLARQQQEYRERKRKQQEIREYFAKRRAVGKKMGQEEKLRRAA